MPDAIDRARIKAKISNDNKLRALKDDLAHRYRGDESLYDKFTRGDSSALASGKKQEHQDMAAAARPRKVLVAGDARGNLERLFSTIEVQHEKKGPFDALICVGDFLPDICEIEAQDAKVSAYILGDRKAPMECFFIDSSAMLLQAVPGGKTVGRNLHFLGGYGIREICGLRVAFLSGTYDPSVYDTPGVDFVGGSFTATALSELKRLVTADRRGIDLLLTCGWPAGCDKCIPAEELRPPVFDDEGEGCPSWQVASAPPLAELCLALEPRYHIFGAANAFYQRPAFRAPRRKHACRLIGLGQVGSASKQRKWLHALALSPMLHMKEADLLVLPANVTPCPFLEGGSTERKRKAETQQPTGALAPSTKRCSSEGALADVGSPDEAILALVSGELEACCKAAERLRSRPLSCGPAEAKLPSKLRMFAAGAATADGTFDMARGEAPSDMQNGSLTPAPASPTALDRAGVSDGPPPVPAEITYRVDAEKQAAAEAYLKRPLEVGVVRFTFTEGGQLGLRLSQDVQPWILEVKDGSLAARKAPRVPLGGIVIAINGYELSQQGCKEALRALSTRPVTLDILWPNDQALPSVVHA